MVKELRLIGCAMAAALGCKVVKGVADTEEALKLMDTEPFDVLIVTIVCPK